MADVEKNREEGGGAHHHISPTTQMSNLPRDLLKRFMAAANNHRHHDRHLMKLDQPGHADAGEEKEEEEIELSLGLSTNGRFGVDPSAKKIKRTTSIPEFVNQARDEEMGVHATPPAAAAWGSGSSSGGGHLTRACSLPTETEEEWRKRKELQTLRRMEARRKRSEKQRSLKAALRERNNHRGTSSEEAAVAGEGSNVPVEQGAGGGLTRTASLTTRVGGLGLNEKGNSGLLPPPSPPQGSIGSSHGTGSSGTSESESQHGQGPTPMDTTSPIGDNLLQDGELKSPATARAGVGENSSKTAAVVTMGTQANRSKDTVKNLLEDMPSVSTKGDGPNGKKVEGFLYRYGKGEEVRILCVCHGSFLTPAEFVKHAGGGDVANPLKHIVVTPSYL